ncbi:MAG: DEAD/DEAH box helicase [Draconibacterium sp.]
MDEKEFIVILTDHRHLGKIFQPVWVEKQKKFYTATHIIKPRDLSESSYPWKHYEHELVKLMDKYSDERLMKRFSRNGSLTQFYASLEPGVFERQVVPYIERVLIQVHNILMASPVRLFKKESKYSNLYDEDVINVPPVFARPEFYFERTETHTSYRLKIFLLDKELPLYHRKPVFVAHNPCLMILGGQLLAFQKLTAKKLMPFLEKEAVTVPNSIEDKYYPGFVLKTIRNFHVEAKGFDIIDTEGKKEALLTLENDLQYQPALNLRFIYDEEVFELSQKKEISVSCEKKEASYTFRRTRRKKRWEEDIKNFLSEKGLKENNGFYRLPGTDLLEVQNALYHYINWIGSERSVFHKNGIRLEIADREKKYFMGQQQLEMKTTANGDWFDVYAIVHFGDYNIPFIRLKKYIINNIREFQLPNGEIAILPEEWFARYKDLLPFGKEHGKHIRFARHHFTLLQETVQKGDPDIKQKLLQMSHDSKKEIPVPPALKTKLRNYQYDGFKWMHDLYKNNMGGCLADDMGLGKTLQTLTLLLLLKRKRQSITTLPATGQLDLFADIPGAGTGELVQPASLIVVPTSLAHNWHNEIAKFTPALKVFQYLGTQRKKVEDMAQLATCYDVIITTYGTVRNDCEHLAQTKFFYLILDESQAIKNPTSKTYKAVLKLNAGHKLVITGTPIENSLSDLWSQMNFLNPGLLGSLAFFQRMFITPIEKHANEEQMEKLQLMIRPFVLRRKKMEVARDLPPLMEEVRICSMADDQQKLYDKEKSIIRNTILSAIEKEGMNKSQFVVLQGLTRLRQLANHPSLLEKDAGESSGKFDEIFRMLQNLVAEKHKVLIFSSFVTHLELLESEIKKQRWKYSKLTGQTTKREEVIKGFQENDENRIFLISLKAGGVGLNLTEADYVFIIDPWWNPAAEIQAINRAHRIGQDKHVFVYRFITENSIEEKIQKLKERKSSLADKFINSNDPFQKITKEEIVELFK